jgi:hypothetical protein
MTTLEEFSKVAEQEARLKRNIKAVKALLALIPRELHQGISITKAKYVGDTPKAFRLTIDGQKFLAVDEIQFQNFNKIGNLRLFHDGFRHVKPIQTKEDFSIALATEYNKEMSIWSRNLLFASLGLFSITQLIITFTSKWTVLGFVSSVILAIWMFAAGTSAYKRFDKHNVQIKINSKVDETTLWAFEVLLAEYNSPDTISPRARD